MYYLKDDESFSARKNLESLESNPPPPKKKKQKSEF